MLQGKFDVGHLLPWHQVPVSTGGLGCGYVPWFCRSDRHQTSQRPSFSAPQRYIFTTTWFTTVSVTQLRDKLTGLRCTACWIHCKSEIDRNKWHHSQRRFAPFNVPIYHKYSMVSKQYSIYHKPTGYWAGDTPLIWTSTGNFPQLSTELWFIYFIFYSSIPHTNVPHKGKAAARTRRLLIVRLDRRSILCKRKINNLLGKQTHSRSTDTSWSKHQGG